MDELSNSISLLKDFFIQAFTDDPLNWLKWLLVFAVLVFGFIIQAKLYKVLEPLWRGSEKNRKMAIDNGHIIKASLVHKRTTHRHQNSRTRRGGSQYAGENWAGKYEYEINGKTEYYWAYFGNAYPPADITLYYVSNPKKVFCCEEYRYRGHLGIIFLPVLFLPFLLAALTMWLLGVKSDL